MLRVFVFVFVFVSALAGGGAVARADTHTPATPVAACSTQPLDDAIARAPKNAAAVRTIGHMLGHLISEAPDDACRGRLFQRFWDYCDNIQSFFASKAERLDEKKRAALMRSFKEFGWTYSDAEAGAYIKDSSDWLLRQAGPALPAAWRAFATLRLRDIAEGFAEDAGLLIGWSTVRQRVRSWEDFDARFPTFERAAEVRAWIKLYLSTLLRGMDNTPAFDRETGAIDKDVRTEIEAYLRDPKARSRKAVRGYYDLLAKNGFKSTPELDTYVAEHDLAVGGEPPQY